LIAFTLLFSPPTADTLILFAVIVAAASFSSHFHVTVTPCFHWPAATIRHYATAAFDYIRSFLRIEASHENNIFSSEASFHFFIFFQLITINS